MPAVIHRYIRLLAGLSLIELLVVTMILGLLAVVAVPTMKAYFERVRVASGISAGRTMQAALASFSTTSDSNQYPASIGSYDELIAIINANGGQLKATEAEAGIIFQQYTALDTDGDSAWDSYKMSLRVIDVSLRRLGWCITIEPSGVTRCAPQ